MTEEELDKKKNLKKRSRIIKSICVSLLAAGVIASLVLSSLAYVNSLNANGSRTPDAGPSDSGSYEDEPGDRPRPSEVSHDTTDDSSDRPADDAEVGSTQEDGVMIMDVYEIESTTDISDAYLSGDSSGLGPRDRQTLEMAKAVLDEIITDGMSDYDKELAVYEWMTNNLQDDPDGFAVVIDPEDNADNPYGVLSEREAVCVGYATTFRLFMQMLEIPCMVVHSDNLIHSWDLVQIGGDWYHTDIYSDAYGYPTYEHMNITDDMMSESGYEWDRDFYPAADSLTYNYTNANSILLGNVYDLPGAVRPLLDENVACRGFRLEGGTGEDGAIAEEILSRIQDELWSIYDGPYNNVELSYIVFPQMDDGSWLIQARTHNYNLDPEPEPGNEIPDDISLNGLDDEDYAQISSSVSEAFSDVEGFGAGGY